MYSRKASSQAFTNSQAGDGLMAPFHCVAADLCGNGRQFDASPVGSGDTLVFSAGTLHTAR
jgi:hypothetical protein